MIKDDLKNWIFNTLSTPSTVFNNMPICPYAKQAWITNKVLVLDKVNNENLHTLLETYEVVIYALNPNDITAEQLYNLSASLSDDVIVALDDHPDYKEQVEDVVLNNGKYALILVQERFKLEQARKILQAKGYYKNWSPKYLKEVQEL